jgi:hypothetical protein
MEKNEILDLEGERDISVYAAEMCRGTWHKSLFLDVQFANESFSYF